MKRAFLAVAVVALFQIGCASKATKSTGPTPFDGAWIGTVSSTAKCTIPSTMDGTVTNGKVAFVEHWSGGTDPLDGTVQADGSFSGAYQSGLRVRTGKFQGDTFSSTYHSKICDGDREIRLDRVK